MLEKNGDISVNYGGVILCWYFLVDFLLSVFEVLIVREDGFKKKKKKGLRERKTLNFANPVPFPLNYLEALWFVCAQIGQLTNLPGGQFTALQEAERSLLHFSKFSPFQQLCRTQSVPSWPALQAGTVCSA